MSSAIRGHCSRIRGLLNAFVDRELQYTDHLLVSRHVATCRECSDELERFKFVKQSLTHLSQPDCSGVLLALKRRVASERRPLIRHAAAVGMWAVASAVIAAIFVSGFAPSTSRPPDNEISNLEVDSDRAYAGGIDDRGAPPLLHPVAVDHP